MMVKEVFLRSVIRWKLDKKITHFKWFLADSLKQLLLGGSTICWNVGTRTNKRDDDDDFSLLQPKACLLLN